MKASCIKAGENYLPAIKHVNRVEVLVGNPLVNIKTARKYAQIEINKRGKL
jgi:hypothetical protein